MHGRTAIEREAGVEGQSAGGRGEKTARKGGGATYAIDAIVGVPRELDLPSSAQGQPATAGDEVGEISGGIEIDLAGVVEGASEDITASGCVDGGAGGGRKTAGVEGAGGELKRGVGADVEGALGHGSASGEPNGGGQSGLGWCRRYC